MNWRAFDLNLLVVFDAVMQSGSVSRAAAQLNMAQPAISHALGRLRHRLEDELFIRTAAGMVPTPKAQELAGPIRAALEELGGALERAGGFQPETASRRFALAMNNRAALTLAAPLAQAVSAAAPGVLLDIRPAALRNVGDMLDRGELDLAIGGPRPEGERFHEDFLMRDDYVAVVRHGHDIAVAECLTAERLAAYPHLVLTSTGEDDGFVDEALVAVGHRRRVGLRAPLLSAAAALEGSDLIAIMSRLIAGAFTRARPLASVALPFPSPLLTTAMVWHRRLHADPAHLWLREMVVNVLQRKS